MNLSSNDTSYDLTCHTGVKHAIMLSFFNCSMNFKRSMFITLTPTALVRQRVSDMMVMHFYWSIQFICIQTVSYQPYNCTHVIHTIHNHPSWLTSPKHHRYCYFYTVILMRYVKDLILKHQAADLTVF